MNNTLIQNINETAKAIFEQNKAVGWWDDMNRCILTTIQLISTEIAEATEGERKNLMDDHLPHRKMGEVELADALIRVLDIGGRFELVIDTDLLQSNVEQIVECATKDKATAAVSHFWINTKVSALGMKYNEQHNAYPDGIPDIGHEYEWTIAEIIATAQHLGYDIEGAMTEKLVYNKQRQDHKRGARAEENGKKF